MYAICLRGDDALPILVQELELKGHRASDYAIWGIGLLKTQSARRVLENMAHDPNWRPKSEAVTEALRLWSLPEARMAKLSLHPDEVDSLASLRVDRSREVLRRIVEQFPSRTIQTAGLCTKVGVHEDSPVFVWISPNQAPFHTQFFWNRLDLDLERSTFRERRNDALSKCEDRSTLGEWSYVRQNWVKPELNQELKLSENTLYLFGDALFNRNEAGNVLWGAALWRDAEDCGKQTAIVQV